MDMSDKSSDRVVLAEKGDEVEIAEKRDDSTDLDDEGVRATLHWTTAVDLDLHCYYHRSDIEQKESRGWLGGLIDALMGDRSKGHIYYAHRGRLRSDPWIYLDEDAGVGDVGGDHEENIRFNRLTHISHAILVASIYDKPNANFASYDGRVWVRGEDREFEVPLTSEETGSWCVIAEIDNTGERPTLLNVNQTLQREPDIDMFM